MDDSKFIIINHEVKEYRGLPEEETLIIPEGVRSIAPYVFSDRKHIKKIIFPESLLSIGEFAFVRCFGIKTLILPKGLTEIKDYAFANIRTKIIAIPEWVTKIGKGAFSGNNRLIGVEIRAKDIEIGDNAFEGCPNVYFYVIPGSDAVDYLNEHNLPYELDYSLLEN